MLAGMRGRAPVACAIALVAVTACGTGIGQTFEPGVEHIPGPGFFLIRVVPAEAIDDRRISFTGIGDTTVLFHSHRGQDRFLSGLDLPATLRATVDGLECSGSIEMVSDMEYDGTLTIEGDACELRLDLVHRTGTVDHQLEDGGPVAS